MAKQYINVKILAEVSKHKLYIYFGEKKNTLNYITAKCMKFVFLMIFTKLRIYDNIFFIYLPLFDKK